MDTAFFINGHKAKKTLPKSSSDSFRKLQLLDEEKVAIKNILINALPQNSWFGIDREPQPFSQFNR